MCSTRDLCTSCIISSDGGRLRSPTTFSCPGWGRWVRLHHQAGGSRCRPASLVANNVDFNHLGPRGGSLNQSQPSQLCQPITASRAFGGAHNGSVGSGPHGRLSPWVNMKGSGPPTSSRQTLMLDETLKCQPAQAGPCNISGKPPKGESTCAPPTLASMLSAGYVASVPILELFLHPPPPHTQTHTLFSFALTTKPRTFGPTAVCRT